MDVAPGNSEAWIKATPKRPQPTRNTSARNRSASGKRRWLDNDTRKKPPRLLPRRRTISAAPTSRTARPAARSRPCHLSRRRCLPHRRWLSRFPRCPICRRRSMRLQRRSQSRLPARFLRPRQQSGRGRAPSNHRCAGRDCRRRDGDCFHRADRGAIVVGGKGEGRPRLVGHGGRGLGHGDAGRSRPMAGRHRSLRQRFRSRRWRQSGAGRRHSIARAIAISSASISRPGRSPGTASPPSSSPVSIARESSWARRRGLLSFDGQRRLRQLPRVPRPKGLPHLPC